MSTLPAHRRGYKDSAADVCAELAAAAVRATHGPEAAEEFLADHGRARSTARAQKEAQAISAARRRRDDPGHVARMEELDGETQRRPKSAKAKQMDRSMRGQFRRRSERDHVRSDSQAQAMVADAFKRHGIRHHYRPFAKLAWFSAYRAGLDRNGVLALQILNSINMPRARVAAVLQAAYRPQAYVPRRDVCTGKREGQTRFGGRTRPMGGRLWDNASRAENHPAAIAVIQVAIFCWLSKVRTSRRGHSYVLRGFGRGLFEKLTGLKKDALFGHDEGLPGAFPALRSAGFFNYHQPPAGSVPSPRDIGPKGHAYNAYWFSSDAAELALEDYHARVRDLARLPALQRLVLQTDSAALDAWLSRAPPDAPSPA